MAHSPTPASHLSAASRHAKCQEEISTFIEVMSSPLNGGFQEPSSGAKWQEIGICFLHLIFGNSSKNAGTQKDSPFTKVQNHLCFQHILVFVYMWMFGASPVAWTKSRLEWNASEKKAKCRVTWGFSTHQTTTNRLNGNILNSFKIIEHHEIPKQAISSLKHGFLTKKKVNLSHIEICFKDFNWISTLFIHEDLHPHLQGLSWESKGTPPHRK